MPIWTIQALTPNGIGGWIAGAAQTFAAINCSKLQRHVRSQYASNFSFTESAQQMDGTALLSPGDRCIIRADNVTYFQGRVTKVPRLGAPASEERRYVISDAWNDLERLVYQQQWNRITGKDESGNPTLAFEYRSEFILGQDVAGDFLNSDAAIIDVLNWAISCGAYFQIGSILAEGGGPAPVPFKEMRDLPCSAVVQELMRLTPDAVSWFDYTESPPSLNITRRAACFGLTLPFTGDAGSINLTPRTDLLRSQVLIRYVANNSVDGFETTTTTIDAAPGGADGTAFDALVATVRLEGSNAVYQKQPVKTSVLPTANSASTDGGPANDPTIQWWQQALPWLNGLGDQLVVTNVYATYNIGQGDDDGTGQVAVDFEQYPNYLIDGGLAGWMNVQWAKCSVTALIKYSYPADTSDYSAQDWAAVKQFGPDDGSGFSPSFKAAATPTLTNAVTQTYSQLSSYTEPEPVPAGLAAILYGALGVLHYEGSYEMINSEVPISGLGCVLNVTGSQQPWAAMNALVQEIVDDLDEGRTTFSVGPPNHLTVQDLMDQLRWTRTRTPSGHSSERTSGAAASSAVNGVTGSNVINGTNPPGVAQLPAWIDSTDDQDNADGSAYSYDALLGYGQSSFSGADGINHAAPLENFEISVGNDGSDWPAPDGGGGYDAESLDNGLSIISGDTTDTNDCIIINRGNGKIYILPSAQQVKVSDEDSGSYIDIDNSDGTIEINNAGSGDTVIGSDCTFSFTNTAFASPETFSKNSDGLLQWTRGNSCSFILTDSSESSEISLDTGSGFAFETGAGDLQAQITGSALFLSDNTAESQIDLSADDCGPGNVMFIQGPFRIENIHGTSFNVMLPAAVI